MPCLAGLVFPKKVIMSDGVPKYYDRGRLHTDFLDKLQDV